MFEAFHELGVHAAKYGAKGLAWIRVDDRAKGREGLNSPIAKFLDDATLVALLDATGLAEHVLWHGSPDDIGNLRDIVAGTHLNTRGAKFAQRMRS